ncbi:MAG: phosphoribosylformylglycinamidine synthase subunit PurQ [Candidatus Sericytochromatia bacterium]|nr:phosphoribosylformylglycinamidine synthase subunit PurQ [Candidatus Sericytochromatia bacterium]
MAEGAHVVIRALVLTGHGINCERETALAFKRAGAQATIAHLADWEAGLVDLGAHHLLALPGGFSFGDHLGSGRALAARLRQGALWEALRHFVDRGGYVLGICNGFQALVKLGLLPALDGSRVPQASLVANASGRFEDRWVTLLPDPESPCTFTAGLGPLELPVRHGEGRLVAAPDVLLRLAAEGLVALRYGDASGAPTEAYPANPNGSPGGIAGLCDPSGRVFGLMPHPEAYLDFTLHPAWTRRREMLVRAGQPVPVEGAGLALFRNVVAHARASLSQPATLG